VKLTIQLGAAGTSSFTSNICTGAGCSGAAIAVSPVESLTLIVTGTTFSGNQAGANGAAIFVDNRITVDFLLTLTSCIFTSNVAKTSGSVLYVSSTATTSSTTIADSTFTTNSATLSDGGVFYVAAYQTNQITFQNSLVPGSAGTTITSSTSGNNGGVFYFAGTTNTLTTDATTIMTGQTAALNGGLLFIAGIGVQTVNIVGGTISDSTATAGRGGIATIQGSDATVTANSAT
jgi:predicted outer membrane repeat protein